MKTNIKRMLRFAAQFKVVLECGHAYECGADTVDRDQLYIGKRVECAACRKEQ